MIAKLNFLQESDIRQIINFCGRSLIEQGITSFDETNEVVQRSTFKVLEDINKPLCAKLNEMTIDELMELHALSLLGSELARYKVTEGFEEWIKCVKYRFNTSTSEQIKKLLLTNWSTIVT